MRPLVLYGALALVVVSTIIYHLLQKITPSAAHPLVTLAVTYAVSTGICIALLPLYPLQEGVLASLRQLNWASVALALAVVGIEMGFLLAYRWGWNVSVASLITNTTVAAALLPLGLLVFGERVAPIQFVGMLVCLVGLVLVNMRQ